MTLILSCDIAARQDWSAFVLGEIVGNKVEVNYVERMQDTPLNQQEEYIVTMCQEEGVNELIIDRGGLGLQMYDSFRNGNGPYSTRFHGIQFTGGHAVTEVDYGMGLNVPKSQLVNKAQALIYQEPPLVEFYDDPMVMLMFDELKALKVKVTDNANEVYDHREGPNDDLAMALAMLLWFADYMYLQRGSFILFAA